MDQRERLASATRAQPVRRTEQTRREAAESVPTGAGQQEPELFRPAETPRTGRFTVDGTGLRAAAFSAPSPERAASGSAHS